MAISKKTHVLVKHQVKDYSIWKSTFDNFKDVRKAGGEKSYQIYHPDDNPNNLFLIFEWDNPVNARNFMDSPELKDRMEKAGVIEKPSVYFLEEADRGAFVN